MFITDDKYQNAFSKFNVKVQSTVNQQKNTIIHIWTQQCLTQNEPPWKVSASFYKVYANSNKVFRKIIRVKLLTLITSAACIPIAAHFPRTRCQTAFRLGPKHNEGSMV